MYSKKSFIWLVAIVIGLSVDAGAAFAGSTACDATGCQTQLTSLTQAPAVSASWGLRLNHSTDYVLFNNYPTIGPRFVSLGGQNDIFVPQSTVTEFTDFLNAAPNVTVDYAVPPSSYTASAAYTGKCLNGNGVGLSLASSPSAIPVPFSVLPALVTSLSPVVVNSYTLWTPSTPPTTTIGTTAAGLSPAQFTYGRNDCSVDNEGHTACNAMNFMEDQQLIFQAAGTAPTFAWQTPAVTSGLYVKSGGTYVPYACGSGTSYGGVINGACNALTNGKYLTSMPTANLCSWGDAGAVTASGSGWTWSCNGVGSGSTNISCSANQQTYHWGGNWSSCSESCGPGTETLSTCYGADGNVYPGTNCTAAQPTQNCNNGSCCSPNYVKTSCSGTTAVLSDQNNCGGGDEYQAGGCSAYSCQVGGASCAAGSRVSGNSNCSCTFYTGKPAADPSCSYWLDCGNSWSSWGDTSGSSSVTGYDYEYDCSGGFYDYVNAGADSVAYYGTCYK